MPWAPGSERSPTVSKIATAKRSSCPECENSALTTPQCGTTCEPLTPRNFLPALIVLKSSPADSRARILALQELEQAWVEADQDYFSKSFASLANFDRDSFSWKTSQLSLFGGLTAFSWSSLRWGTTVAGRLYQPQRWEPRTLESDGSFWLTPRASDTCRGENQNTFLKRMGDRTDRCAQSLAAQVRNPKTWPTPCARDWKDTGTSLSELNRNTPGLSAQAGGQLNPTWVEWLMGYPSEWTALEGWATQWFRPRRAKRSKD